MSGILVRSIGCMVLIGWGYGLKRIGILKKEYKEVFGKILMYIILPAAFIANFSSFQKDEHLLIYFLLGLGANLLMIGISYRMARKMKPEDKALYILEGSGYNIGAFTIPFISAFFEPAAVVITSLFDIGNSIMCTGGTFSMAKGFMHRGEDSKGRIQEFFKNLISSIPFDTYIVMLFLSLAGISLPDGVNQMCSMIGAPAIVITMIMIGVTFEVELEKGEIGEISRILIMRYSIGILLGLMIWFLIPISPLAKKALVICVLAPATSTSPTFCHLCGCRPSIYGAVSSLTVPISLALDMMLLYCWN